MAKQIIGAYFSATGTTQKVVREIGMQLGASLGLPFVEWDFTSPEARKEIKKFTSEDVVVFGTPVIAGRVPNVLLKYLATRVGNGAIAIPVVCFGNRAYDDALIELRDILEESNMKTIAGGGFPCQHSFSNILGMGRPNAEDLETCKNFGQDISNKINRGNYNYPIQIGGNPKPYDGYYKPRDRAGNPVDIRKVTPITSDACMDCKICADACPMGSIDYNDVSKINGICMKCCSCIKKCPTGAKSFTDAKFIYHQVELEECYSDYKNIELFI